MPKAPKKKSSHHSSSTVTVTTRVRLVGAKAVRQQIRIISRELDKLRIKINSFKIHTR